MTFVGFHVRVYYIGPEIVMENADSNDKKRTAKKESRNADGKQERECKISNALRFFCLHNLFFFHKFFPH